MPTELPRALLEFRYYKAAQEYLRKLPPEHFMEATPQATQRKITLESLDLVQAKRPDVQIFNELLVQYPLPRRKRLGQVVPDNMVVVHSEPIKADGSYNVPLQPVGPFWVLEYVSKNNRRKDYDENMRKYEHELKVPYYMLFVPDEQELTLYRYVGERYVTVTPNEQGRYAIQELELEIAVLEGWVRYWYQGDLLPLPADLQNALDDTRRRLAEMTRRAETEARRAETQTQRAETEARRAETEQHGRLTAERELAQIRAELEQLRARRNSSE